MIVSSDERKESGVRSQESGVREEELPADS